MARGVAEAVSDCDWFRLLKQLAASRCGWVAFTLLVMSSSLCSACSQAAQTTIAVPGYYRYDYYQNNCTTVTISSDNVSVDVVGVAVHVSSLSAALRNVTIQVRGLRDVAIVGTPLVQLSVATLENVHVSVRDCVNVTVRNTPLIVSGGVGQLVKMLNTSFEIENVTCVAELVNGGKSDSPSMLRAVIAPDFGILSGELTPMTVVPLLVDSVMSGAVTSYTRGVRIVMRRVCLTAGMWWSADSGASLSVVYLQTPLNASAGLARDVSVVMEDVRVASCAEWHRQPTVNLSWLGEWCGSGETWLLSSQRRSASTLLEVPKFLSLLYVDAKDGCVLLNFTAALRDVTLYSSVSALVHVMIVNVAAMVNISVDLTRITLRASVVVTPVDGDFSVRLLSMSFGQLLTDCAIQATHVSIRGFLCSGRCLWDTNGSSSLESAASNVRLVSCVSVAIQNVQGYQGPAYRTVIMIQNVSMESDISHGVVYNPTVIDLITSSITYVWGALSSSLVYARMDCTDLVIAVTHSTMKIRQMDLRFPPTLGASIFSKAVTSGSLVSLPAVINTTAVTVTDSTLVLDALNVSTGGNNASAFVALVMVAAAGDADILHFLHANLPDAVLKVLGIDFDALAANRGIDVGNGLQRDVHLTVTRSKVYVSSAVQSQLCSRAQVQSGMLPSLHQSVCLLNPISARTVNATYVVQDSSVLYGSVLAATKQSSITMESVTIVVRNVSCGAVVQAVGGSAVAWRNVTLRVEGSTVVLALSAAVGGSGGAAAAASLIVPSAAVYGLGWPDVERSGVAAEAAIVTMRGSRVLLCGSVFAGFSSVLQRDVITSAVSGWSLGNAVSLCGCNGYAGNGSTSTGSSVTTLSALLPNDVSAVGAESVVSEDAWTGPVAAGAAGLSCASNLGSHPRSPLSSVTRGITAVAASLLSLTASGVNISPLQMTLRMNSIGCMRMRDGDVSDEPFQGDPVSNPLQMGQLWLLSDGIADGIPEEARNAVGAVLGACVLMGVCSVVSTVTVALELRRRQRRGSHSVSSLLRQAFEFAGGWTSSYRGAYIVLQPSLVASGTGLLLYAMLSDGTARCDGSCVVWLVCGGAVGLVVGVGPLLWWSWFVLRRWRSTATFPFRLRTARRAKGLKRRGCADAALRAALGAQREYHLKRPGELPNESAALRDAVAYRAVVETYVERRRWYFVVDGALNGAGGVLGGASWAAGWCGVQPAVAALCVSVTSLMAVVVLRPQVSRRELLLSALVSGAGVVSGILLVASGGESAAAADVALYSMLGLFFFVVLERVSGLKSMSKAHDENRATSRTTSFHSRCVPQWMFEHRAISTQADRHRGEERFVAADVTRAIPTKESFDFRAHSDALRLVVQAACESQLRQRNDDDVQTQLEHLHMRKDCWSMNVAL